MVSTAPDVLTCVESVTGMVVVVPSVRFLSRMSPVPTTATSLKFTVRFVVVSTFVAPTTGLRAVMTGGVVSVTPPSKSIIPRPRASPTSMIVSALCQ